MDYGIWYGLLYSNVSYDMVYYAVSLPDSAIFTSPTIFRSATGENWHMVMKDCYNDALCDSRAGQDAGATCGNTVAAIVYFCSFYFLCSFLVSLRDC